MKKLMFVMCLTLATPVVLADTPRADARQERQDERIDQGVASGELTKREAAKLEAQQEHIENKEERAEADGVVTAREKARIERSQDRANRRIAKQKHDRQDRD
jgi:hypothetical protein